MFPMSLGRPVRVCAVGLLTEITPHLLGMDWMDPQWWLDRFGAAFFWLSLVILFVECGLFFPFLPGDTLLFAMGLFISRGDIDVFPGPDSIELLLALTLFSAAAFLGNLVGYEIGRAIGPPLYERNGRILKRDHFERTEAFFDRHGRKALVIGRFVPVVRTYVTVVAGASGMGRPRFLTWSLVGALLWVLSITLVGYVAGDRFPWLASHIDYVILGLLALTVVPVGIHWWRERGSDREKSPAGTK